MMTRTDVAGPDIDPEPEKIAAFDRYAWGFELGNRSLRALRLGLDRRRGHVVALDYDIVPLEAIAAKSPAGGGGAAASALKTLLGHHEMGEDPIAVSVSDSAGLLNYCEIPPIDDSKLRDLVNYEAKMQIPVPLEDVVWDFQRFTPELSAPRPAGSMDLLCLSALRYDRFDAAMQPFDEVGLAVDLLQLRPAALWNFAKFTRIGGGGDEEPLAMIDLGSKSTEITFIDGPRALRRSVAIGGDHFTKAFALQSQIPFAKAEHMKRNSSRASDPRTVIEPMRDVFEAFAAEILKALRTLSPQKRRPRVVAFGKGFQLPFLNEYLGKKLSLRVEALDEPARVDFGPIENEPMFRENRSSFAVCCGLAIQALDQAELTVNLIPSAMRPKRSRPASRVFSWFGRNKA